MNKNDFAAEVTSLQGNMYRLALSILRNETQAEDAVSEAIVRAYEKLDHLKDKGKFKPWILQIVVNEARRIY
ncbi:MAG: sigma factor [Lachnospiraceae bacterium]|nr:sigma factor [Lachnospiraceae bacterium]